ncbi:hypothetical protein HY404_03980 [Candidatus Microgenomates bacterium]|nr:hypothetical protein [Candidatus Microgenomates bacterium]
MPKVVKSLTKKDVQQVLIPLQSEMKELRREASLWKIEAKESKARIGLLEYDSKRLGENILLLKDEMSEQFHKLVDKFITMLDPIMGELKSIREESDIHILSHDRIEKSIDKFSQRITKIESTS